jgi:GMP synthase-like glutamine amidotransferase
MAKRVAVVQCRSDAVHRALELEEFLVAGDIDVRDVDAYGMTYPHPGPREGQIVDGFVDHFAKQADQYCAVIIGGSSDHNLSRDPFEQTAELVKVFSAIESAAREYSVPIYAACLGGHVGAYASRVPIVSGHRELGPVEITVTEAGMADPLFSDIARRTEALCGQPLNKFYAHTGHGDAVLVEDATIILNGTLLAYNVVCGKEIVQGMCVRDMYWVQFHAESHDRARVERRWTLAGYDYSNVPVLDTKISATILRNFLTEAGYERN